MCCDFDNMLLSVVWLHHVHRDNLGPSLHPGGSQSFNLIFNLYFPCHQLDILKGSEDWDMDIFENSYSASTYKEKDLINSHGFHEVMKNYTPRE